MICIWEFDTSVIIFNYCVGILIYIYIYNLLNNNVIVLYNLSIKTQPNSNWAVRHWIFIIFREFKLINKKNIHTSDTFNNATHFNICWSSIPKNSTI